VLTSRIEERDADRARLYAQLDQARKQHEEGQQTIAGLRAQTGSIQDLRSQLGQAQTTARQSSDQLRAKDAELVIANGKVSQHERQLNARHQEIASLNDQIRKLEAAQKAAGRPSTYGLASASKFTVYPNFDMMGGDYFNEKDMSREACVSKCESESQCVAYTYDKWKKHCSLKNAIQIVSLEPKGDTGVRSDQKTPV
jgi:hypothetical protein